MVASLEMKMQPSLPKIFFAQSPDGKRKAEKMENFKKNLKVIALFMLPAFMIYLIFAVIPIAQSIYFAFFNWNGIHGAPLKFVGLNNFRILFGMREFYHTFSNTARLFSRVFISRFL